MALHKNVSTEKNFLSKQDALIELSRLVGETSSSIEGKILDTSLETLCREALDRYDDSDIESALAILKNEENQAYDTLLAIAEDAAHTLIDKKGAKVLILVPILAWSRYRIVFGRVDEKPLKAICDLYKTLFGTKDTIVTIGNSLISAEHIPENLSEVRRLLVDLAGEKPSQGSVRDISRLLSNDPPPDFSDTRYLVLAVSGKDETKLFKTYTSYVDRAHNVMDFALKSRELLAETFRGSVFEVQNPTGFFNAWRESEAAMRVFALKSLVEFVACMGFGPSELIVTTATFLRPTESDTQPNAEVRIAISTRNAPGRVIAGVVWPCGPEEAETHQELAGDIVRNSKVSKVVLLDQSFTMEWCEDCGAPLYANPEGMVVHIELPEEIQPSVLHPTLN